MPPGPLYAHLFDIDEGDELYSIRRLNSTDGTPVSLEQTLVPVKLFPGIEDVDVSVFSLYETYEMCGRPVALAQEKLDVVALSARDAGLLQVERGASPYPSSASVSTPMAGPSSTPIH